VTRAPKPNPRIDAAVATARGLIEKHGVRHAGDIHVATIAASERAYVLYEDLRTADAQMTRAGGTAYLTVPASQRGKPRARWSIAHELGHVLLHPDDDAIARVHGGGPERREHYRLEREADAFAAELLMPEALFAKRCHSSRPDFAALEGLADEFGTSLQAAGVRYARFATSACALVECRKEADGWRIQRASKSASFRGDVAQRRRLPSTSQAAAVALGHAVAPGLRPNEAWSAKKHARDIQEDAARVPESGVVLAWLWHP